MVRSIYCGGVLRTLIGAALIPVTLSAWPTSLRAACSVAAGGKIECSGTFTGTGIDESSPTGVDLSADGTTDITTSNGSAYGIRVESIGPKGGDGRDGTVTHGPHDGDPGVPSGNVTVESDAKIQTSGSSAIGIFGLARAGDGGEGGDGGPFHSGRAGGAGGDNSGVTVSIESSGEIVTQGASAIGIVGQNHGGIGGEGGGGGWFTGGGSGGGGGHGGTVTITNDGSVVTNGDHAFGLFVHSVGGFGGDGGGSVGFIGYGGSGGSAGNGGSVSASNASVITTHGDYANAIYAQSVGGGGGRGGNGIGVVGLGGVGGFGGDGSTVDVSNLNASGDPADAHITTSGIDAIAIFAQSVGGSGGDGGDSAGLAAIGGSGDHGGAGGNVTVTNGGTIETTGRGAIAIHAQSIGGGGGHGGSAAGFSSLGGDGGNGGDAGTVDVSNSTNAVISTEGSDAAGIFAQSVGGGGGDGGASLGVAPGISLSIGGSGSVGGHGNTVTVLDCSTSGGSSVCEDSSNGTIDTKGDRSHGIHAQGIGGGGGRGGFSIALAGGPVALSAAFGGSGGGGGDGSIVNVSSNSNITTQGNHSYGISAESVGGGGGSGGFAVAGTASDGPSISVSMGGSGAGGGNGNTVTVDALGNITTGGEVSHGLFAQSIGGGGGNGGFAVSGAISTTGAAAVAMGGTGSGGGHGGDVHVTSSGAITTTGVLSNAIHAQSIGGGGGHGGFAVGAAATSGAPALSVGLGGSGGGGGSSDTVEVTADGSLMTTGYGSHAVFAQSVGGGGGSGGFSGAFSATFGDGADIGVSIGGSGSNAGHGDDVTVTTNNTVSTTADDAVAVVAQSIGGGGGHGGFGLSASMSTGSSPNASVTIGGSGGGGGNGGDVTVSNNGTISTDGTRAHAIHAQSIGGGGGTGGFSLAGTIATTSSSTNISVSIGGSGGTASHGGTVDVTSSGAITTTGDDAIGAFIQSIGGGGGSGGMALSGSMSGNQSRNADLSIGGNGGAGGDGGAVTANFTESVSTEGDRAHGIHAQSTGGGGGSGGLAMVVDLTNGGHNTQVNVAVGGRGGVGGTGNTVDVTATGGVSTKGFEATGVYAQSIGGGGGHGGSASTSGIATAASGIGRELQIGVDIGGHGGSGGTADAVTVTTGGLIQTAGDAAHGVHAQSIGGGGGRGGAANSFSFFTPGGSGGTTSDNKSINISVGGNGGTGNHGGSVTVTNLADIVTSGADSYGIFAQGIGGGGGEGGHAGHAAPIAVAGQNTIPPGLDKVKFYKNVRISVGGSGGASGDGGDVLVTSGDRSTNTSRTIVTQGDGSFGIAAQSIGGGGGIGGAGVTGPLGTVGIGGAGGAAGDGKTVTVDVLGNIVTNGKAAHGIMAQSIGGGGGIAGAIDRGIINTGIGLGFQRTGGSGGSGGNVTINSEGTIQTKGHASYAIFAQSVGGGGGILGDTGNGLSFLGSVGGTGDAGNVNITHKGALITNGDLSSAIFAQSTSAEHHGTVTINLTGAGVMTTGDDAHAVHSESVSKTGGDVTLKIGGMVISQGARSRGIHALSEGATGKSGSVNVTVGEGVQTLGVDAVGLSAVSKGVGSSDVTVSLTGDSSTIGNNATVIESLSDGGTGAGGDVTVTMDGSLSTSGSAATGISATSSGSGSGDVTVSLTGDGSTTGSAANLIDALSDGGTGASGDVNVTMEGLLSTRGTSATGISATSSGSGSGDVTVSLTGDGSTTGSAANLIDALSNGGTGASSDVTVTIDGSLSTQGASALGVSARSIGTTGSGAVDVSMTGDLATNGRDAIGILAESTASAGASGRVTVDYSGSLTTKGTRAHGISAASSGTTTAGDVQVTAAGNITANGLDADAVRIDAMPGAKISLDLAEGTYTGGSGTGAAVRFTAGGSNSLNNAGTLSAKSGKAVVATSGDDSLDNSGTILGNIFLGTGLNSLMNRVGALLTGNSHINLGGGTLTNSGDISPSGSDTVGTTNINGDYVQKGSGRYLLDLDFSSAPSDLINVSGSANLDGLIVVNLKQLEDGDPVTIMTAANGAVLSGLSVADTLALDYGISVDGSDVNLTVDYDFDIPGLTPNQQSMALYINRILDAGASDAMNSYLVALGTMTDPDSFQAAVASINPEEHLSDLTGFYNGAGQFANKLLSCPVHSGPNAAIREGQCSWVRITQRRVRQETTTNAVGFDQNSSEAAGGLQTAIAPNWRLGGAFGFASTTTSNNVDYSSEGDSYSGGLVLKYTNGPLLFAAAVSGAYSEFEGTRQINFPGTPLTAVSDSDSMYVSGRLRAAYLLEGGRFYAKPLVDFDITHLSRDGFRETGAGVLSAVSEGVDETLYAIRPAIQIGANIGLGQARYVRAFLEGGVTFNPNSDLVMPFRLAGAPLDAAPFRITSNISDEVYGFAAGLEMVSPDDVNFSLRYDSEFSDDRTAHSGTFKLSIGF